MSRVKTGIVGCGVIGRTHLRCTLGLDRLEVVGLADADLSAASKLASEFGIGKYYGDAYELIDDPEVEAVVLAVPTGPRLGMALRAISQGKRKFGGATKATTTSTKGSCEILPMPSRTGGNPSDRWSRRCPSRS